MKAAATIAALRTAEVPRLFTPASCPTFRYEAKEWSCGLDVRMWNRIFAGISRFYGNERHVHPYFIGMAKRFLQARGQQYPEDGSGVGRALHGNLAAMILNN